MSKGVDPTVKNNDGETAYDLAHNREHWKVVSLLRNEADIID